MKKCSIYLVVVLLSIGLWSCNDKDNNDSPTPVISLSTPADAAQFDLDQVANVNFSWKVDDASFTGPFTLLLSKTQDMTSPVSFTGISGLSKELTNGALNDQLVAWAFEAEETATVYWAVKATGAVDPATRSLKLKLIPEDCNVSAPEDVSVLSGSERALIKWKHNATPGITIVITWDGGGYQEFSTNEIATDGNMDSVYINGLTGGSYTFNIENKKNEKCSSAPVQQTVTVYDNGYGNTLSNRNIKLLIASVASDERKVEWETFNEANALFSVIKYTNLDGSETFSAKIAPSDVQTVISGAMFEYRTAYQPENCIDTFYTAYKQNEITMFYLDKTGWSVEQFSSEYPGIDSEAIKAIDGINDNRWHTWIDAPHWIIIDFGGEVTVSHWGIWSGLDWGVIDRRFPAEFELYTRSDKPDNPDTDTGWTKIGTFETDVDARTQIIAIDHPVTGRYMKFLQTQHGPDSCVPDPTWNNFMVIGEFDAYVD